MKKIEAYSRSCDEKIENKLSITDSILNEFTKTIMKPAKEVEQQLQIQNKYLNDLEMKAKNSDFVIKDVVKKLI